MKLYEGLLFLLIGIITFSVHVNAICEHFGNNCPEDAPCCNGGWCSNDPKFCSIGCEPLNSFTEKSCTPKPPCVNFYDDFSAPKIVNDANFTGDPHQADWTSDFLPDYSSTDGSNLVLGMKLDTKKNSFGKFQGFGTTVSSTRWMLYGTVSARIKTGSTSLGVVSSFVVSNNTVSGGIGDEIDYEWVGLNRDEVQSNYYWNGNLDYTKGMHHALGYDTTQSFHVYTIDWQPEALRWYVDGALMRTLYKNSTFSDNVYKYPSVPSRIAFSIWDGGMGAPGTAGWAGTPTDWSKDNQVYNMFVDWVNITCATPDDPSAPWPPEGYGPKKTSNSTTSGNSTNTGSTSGYTTLGASDPNNPNPTQGSDPSSPDIVGNPSAPDYSGSQVKKLAVPIGVVLGLIVGGVVLFTIWKCAFRSRGEPVTPQSKW